MKLYDIPEEGMPVVNPEAAADWKPEDKVIVIGAGIAGISAAYTLKYLNVPFILLEASDHFGGRVQRNEEFIGDGVHLDIGAEWIHTTRDASCLKELLLGEEDRKSVEQFMEEEVIVYQPSSFYYFDSCYDSFVKRNFMKMMVDHEYKFKTKSWSYYLETFLFSHVKDKIEYQAVVKEIDYTSPEKIKVTLANGKVHEGARVICATPLSVIKRRHLKFKPDLCKEKKDVLEKTRIRPGFKVAIKFKKKFYNDVFFEQGLLSYLFTVTAGVGSEKTYFDALLGKGIEDKHVLGLYCYGSTALDLSKFEEEDLLASVIEKLDMMYDGQATENYIEHTIKNWTNEPHIHGAFSHALYTSELTDAFVEKPLDDRVFFAGEHVSGKFMPTVHGAGFSGRRAAMNAIGKEYHYY